MAPAPCPPALLASVADAYRVFRRRSVPQPPLDVCLDCCVSEQVERELRLWPLTRLTARHLREYNESAKNEVQQVAEVGYLLPRMLELLAHGEEIHHSTEIQLDRVGRCVAADWNADERAVLDRFAANYFDAVLHSERHAPYDDPLSVLLMFDIGGIDIGPLLDAWLTCEDPRATVQFIVATYWDFWTGHTVANAFATDRPAFRAQVEAWVLDASHRQRFAAKMLTPEFQHLAALQPQMGRTPFREMEGAVFDHLASGVA